VTTHLPDHHEHSHHLHQGHDASHAADKHPQTAKSRCELLENAIRELLTAKGIITAAQVRETVEALERTGPELGGRIVARAWVDPDYRERCLADGTRAAEELGIPMGTTRLCVVESTAIVHNLIVCTLCSCYPRTVLGLPPVWYKSKEYRSRAVREPRAVLAEFGTDLPEGVTVRVHDSTADLRYLVLPERPAGTDGWSEAALAGLVTRDSMIGVSRVAAPSARAT
jgi:nitrile hydratase